MFGSGWRPQFRHQGREVSRILNFYSLWILRVGAISTIKLHQWSLGRRLILNRLLILEGAWGWGDSLILTDIIFLRCQWLTGRIWLMNSILLKYPIIFVDNFFLWMPEFRRPQLLWWNIWVKIFVALILIVLHYLSLCIHKFTLGCCFNEFLMNSLLSVFTTINSCNSRISNNTTWIGDGVMMGKINRGAS